MRARLLLVIVALCGLANMAWTQDEYDDVKAGMSGNMRAYSIYSVARNTVWPEVEGDTSTTFRFGLLGTDTATIKIYKSFKFASKFRKLNKKPIRGVILEKIEDIEEVSVVYVNNTGAFDIAQVNEAIAGKPILLITDDYPFEQSMVNYIKTNVVDRFEVNLTKMREAGLEPRAMLKGLSVRTEESFQNADEIIALLRDSVDVKLSQEDLKLLADEFSQKVEQIEMQELEIGQQTEELEILMGEVDEQKAKITAQKNRLKEQARQVQMSKRDLEALLSKSREQEQALDATKRALQAEMTKLDGIRKQFNDEKLVFLEEQIFFKQERAKQDSLIAESEGAIAENERRIQEQKKSLLDKDAKISDQGDTIEQQGLLIWGGTAAFLIIAALAFFMYRNYRDKKRANAQLASKNEIIASQKSIVEEKNKEMMDSIVYAKRLQDAILPPPKMLQDTLGDSFVLFKPKDIVAGDFYWIEKMNGSVLFAAADCTGHGVPGAMVSVVCSNALNQAVKEFGLTDPAEILTKVRELILKTFEKSESEVKDGMDVSLCSFDIRTRQLTWAGANNPLWIVRKTDKEPDEEENKYRMNGYELLEMKPDKQPVGQYSEIRPFTTNQIEVGEGDVLYLFTDGYADQFGGAKGKKFKASNFKELLLSVQDRSMEEQMSVINATFEDWRGDLEQIDDVCVMAVRMEA